MIIKTFHPDGEKFRNLEDLMNWIYFGKDKDKWKKRTNDTRVKDGHNEQNHAI